MSNIVVKEVSKIFDDAEVLHDINLEFKEGHIYGFVVEMVAEKVFCLKYCVDYIFRQLVVL